MQSQGRSFAKRPAVALFAFFSLAGTTVFLGCASPGAPRPPSLHLPQPVRDLVATRSGDDVQLRFTVPSETTDGLPLRETFLHGALCLQASPGSSCAPIASPGDSTPLRIQHGASRAAKVTWKEPLSPELRVGPARPIAYRLKLTDEAGRSAGFSDPAYVAAGDAPPPVTSFTGQGTRPGILLQWTPAPGKGEVLLERTQLDPPPHAPETAPKHDTVAHSRSLSLAAPRSRSTAESTGDVWLQADPGNVGASQTLDGTVVEGVRYRYLAVRRTVAHVGGRTLELRSAPSSPVELTWRDIYPPARPEGLTAVGFESGSGTGTQTTAAYAVDLIWQPVNDPRVTGYLVSRVPLTPEGAAAGATEPLTPQPVTTPAFHDTSALPNSTYRYLVTTVDARGNTSEPATAVVQAAGH